MRVGSRLGFCVQVRSTTQGIIDVSLCGPARREILDSKIVSMMLDDLNYQCFSLAG